MSPALVFMMVVLPSATPELDRGARALEEARFEDAVAAFSAGLARGPHDLETHARLYEQLGIAYAYLEDRERALAAFDRLLALDPGHFLPYTVSPKATFLFEAARRRSDARTPASLQLSWPRDLRTDDTVPLTLEVLADPMRMIDRLVINSRAGSARHWENQTVTAPTAGAHTSAELAPPPSATSSTAIEFYVTGLDAAGNEVLRVGRPDAPRRVYLRYDPPDAWFERWWVWAVVGIAVAGAATTAAILTRPPAETVDGTLSL